jgi:hypothetical protein
LLYDDRKTPINNIIVDVKPARAGIPPFNTAGIPSKLIMEKSASLLINMINPDIPINNEKNARLNPKMVSCKYGLNNMPITINGIISIRRGEEPRRSGDSANIRQKYSYDGV